MGTLENSKSKILGNNIKVATKSLTDVMLFDPIFVMDLMNDGRDFACKKIYLLKVTNHGDYQPILPLELGLYNYCIYSNARCSNTLTYNHTDIAHAIRDSIVHKLFTRLEENEENIRESAIKKLFILIEQTKKVDKRVSGILKNKVKKKQIDDESKYRIFILVTSWLKDIGFHFAIREPQDLRLLICLNCLQTLKAVPGEHSQNANKASIRILISNTCGKTCSNKYDQRLKEPASEKLIKAMNKIKHAIVSLSKYIKNNNADEYKAYRVQGRDKFRKEKESLSDVNKLLDEVVDLYIKRIRKKGKNTILNKSNAVFSDKSLVYDKANRSNQVNKIVDMKIAIEKGERNPDALKQLLKEMKIPERNWPNILGLPYTSL